MNVNTILQLLLSRLIFHYQTSISFNLLYIKKLLWRNHKSLNYYLRFNCNSRPFINVMKTTNAKINDNETVYVEKS